MARRRRRRLPPLWTFADALHQLFRDWKRRRRVSTPSVRACRFLLEELEDRTAPSVTPFGNEFLVNSYTQGSQQTFYSGPPDPAVVSQAVAINPSDGSYVVTWASQNQTGGAGWDVYARLYNANGTPLGSPFLVNTTTSSDQLDPNVAMAANGSFVITWQGRQSGHWGVYAQRYDATAAAQGSEFLVSPITSTDQVNPAVAAETNGDFVIAWSSQNQGTNSWDVDAQVYSAAGVALGGPIVVGTTTNTTSPSVAMAPNGHFVVAWDSDGTGSVHTDSEYAQLYSAAGIAQGGPILVGTTADNNPAPPSVAMAANGNFVVTWDSNDQGGDVLAQLYTAGGSPQGAVFLVNSTTTGYMHFPRAAMSAAGDFVITWSSQGQTGGASTWDVYAQQFDASGTAQGSNFLVNTFTAGDQEYSSAALDDQHQLVVVWSSNNQDGSGWGVYAQQYNLSGITVTPTTQLTTTKAGGTATFSVVLNSQPTADVTVGLSSSNTQEGTLSTSSLTFTSSNWNVAQQVTITGHNDGTLFNTSYAINFAPAQSNDPSYTGLVIPSLSVVNNWIALPGITVTPLTPQTTTEAGGTAQFSVVLNSQPTGTVLIPISSSDTSAGTVDKSQLTFDASDWNVAQIVTVTGVDDQIATPDRTYTVTIGPAQSTDLLYNLLAASSSSLSFTDQETDTAGVTVTPLTPLTTTESGGTAQFSVALTSAPTGTVVIPIASTDTTAGTVDRSQLTFDASDWNVAQVVTVTGATDYLVTPSRTYTINIGAAQSSDSFYNNQFASSLTLTDQETDNSGVLVTLLTPQTTTESGGTAQLSVRLMSQPAANVTVPIASSDITAGTVDRSQLTFTPLDWSQAQLVTITGADDGIVTPDRTYYINIGATQSQDPVYNQIAGSVRYTDQETDTPGVLVTAASPLMTTEAGGTAQFSVVLASKPTTNVVIQLASSDPTAGTVSTATVTFTPTDWSQPQTVTVTGVDDQVYTSNRTYNIVFSPALSGDSTYNGWQLASLRAVNVETDTPLPVTPTLYQPQPIQTEPQPIATSDPATASGSPSLSGSSSVTTSPAATVAGATSAMQQIILQTQSTTTAAASSSGSLGVSVVLAGGSQGTNSGAMTLTSLISGSQALSSAASGGGGGGVASSHTEEASAKAPGEAPVPVTNTPQAPSREVGAAPVPPVNNPLVPPATTNLVPAPGVPAMPTMPVVKLDFLRRQLDGGRPLDGGPVSRLEKATKVIFTSGTIVSVGYVLFSSRGGSWLLSALTARPLWKQLDPLEVLFAWEEEKKRRGLEAEDETLQSLVE